MVTPVEVGLAAGKFGAKFAPGLVFDFLKRRKLKAAYVHAAERVINYYGQHGHHEGTPAWHGIVNLIKDPRCVDALSVGQNLGEDELEYLGSIYTQEDPGLEQVLCKMIDEVVEACKSTLPLEAQTLANIITALSGFQNALIRRQNEQL